MLVRPVEAFQPVQSPDRVVPDTAITQSLVENGVDRLSEQEQGEISQFPFPDLNLAGILVLIVSAPFSSQDSAWRSSVRPSFSTANGNSRAL